MSSKKRRPKVHEDGRVRAHFGIRPEVYDALKSISERDRRSMTEELSWLVLERQRSLDGAGKIGK